LGISTVLVYLAIGYFLFQKNLLFPKIQASPATCTVDDDLKINHPCMVGIELDQTEKLHIKDGDFRIENGVIQGWGTLDFYPDIDATGDDYVSGLIMQVMK
jgi:hypothetical protein